MLSPGGIALAPWCVGWLGNRDASAGYGLSSSGANGAAIHEPLFVVGKIGISPRDFEKQVAKLRIRGQFRRCSGLVRAKQKMRRRQWHQPHSSNHAISVAIRSDRTIALLIRQSGGISVEAPATGASSFAQISVSTRVASTSDRSAPIDETKIMVGEQARNSRAIPQISGLDCGGASRVGSDNFVIRIAPSFCSWRAALRDRWRTATGLAPSSFTVTMYSSRNLLMIR